MPPRIAWPGGRRFAFTVFDDTDWATVARVKPVYDFLRGLGIRTTKSVWVFGNHSGGKGDGDSCENPDYLNWVRSIQDAGFEIALHNVAPTTSPRELTQTGLDRFRELFGDRQLIHCNHQRCHENMYWGDARLSGWRRILYNIVTRGRNRGVFRGHMQGDRLFWGDLCRQRVRYVRNFAFNELNTLAACPQMPYHDPARPYVNYWFAATNGSSLPRFLRNFTPMRIEQLIAEGGLCIAYVHFAAGFVTEGRVHPDFRKRLEQIAAAKGWFAPVSEVLDFLRRGANSEERTIRPSALRRLETRWLLEKVFARTS